MASAVTVTFRNTTGFPVKVQVHGNLNQSSAVMLYTGIVSGLSGVFNVPTGYGNYSCAATGLGNYGNFGGVMTLPVIRTNATVTVVFQAAEGDNS